IPAFPFHASRLSPDAFRYRRRDLSDRQPSRGCFPGARPIVAVPLGVRPRSPRHGSGPARDSPADGGVKTFLPVWSHRFGSTDEQCRGSRCGNEKRRHSRRTLMAVPASILGPIAILTPWLGAALLAVYHRHTRVIGIVTAVISAIASALMLRAASPG